MPNPNSLALIDFFSGHSIGIDEKSGHSIGIDEKNTLMLTFLF